MKKTVVYNARLVDAETDCLGAVVACGGLIERVVREPAETEEEAIRLCGRNSPGEPPELIDAGGHCLMPAFIDTHAHFRFPGQTEKEDLASGLSAAEAGGFGAVVLMPNTSPVVSDPALAAEIVSEAGRLSRVRVFQAVSLTRDFGGADSSHLDGIDRAKIPVVSEDGRDVADPSVMLGAMRRAAEKNVVVACHCEDVALAAEARKLRAEALSSLGGRLELGRYWRGRPVFPEGTGEADFEEARRTFSRAHEILAEAEDAATERNLALAGEAGCRIHVCHCSTARSLAAVRRAKAAGVKATVEVTPHHLAVSLANVPLGDFMLVNPPVRPEADRRVLIEALRDGSADCIGTDHAPHTMADKAAGAPGFPGLETAFSVCNTILCGAEGFSLSRLSALMSANAAKILGLNAGLLREGMDASLVVVDPSAWRVVDPSSFRTKGRSSPFAGVDLLGRVVRTLLL